MTTKRITTGWRGFSTAKESAYGTPTALATAFNFEGPITDFQPNEVQTDENEITGLNEAAMQEILNWKLDGSHQQRSMPYNMAHFLTMVMGVCRQMNVEQSCNFLRDTYLPEWVFL